MIDIDRIRADTPAAARLAYLHNAGAALMPLPVVAAMKQHIDLESEIGGYAAADRESDRLDAVYGSVARLLNAAPDEIALMENATVAWQMAFYALPFRAGDRILTAEAEYAANYVAFLQVAKRTGAVIDIVPSDASGELDINALERMIDTRVKLIAITWVPTNGGLVNPAAAIGEIARAHRIPYLLDACQAVGQMQVDVEAIGCDMLSATGRKFLRGPRGTGFLYVRRALMQQLEPPMIDHFARAITISSATIRAGSKPGKTITSRGWGWAQPSTTPLQPASAPSSSAAAFWRIAFATDSPPSAASPFAISAGRRVPSSASRWRAPRRTRSSAALQPPASPSARRIRRAPASTRKSARCRWSCGHPRITTTPKPRSIG